AFIPTSVGVETARPGMGHEPPTRRSVQCSISWESGNHSLCPEFGEGRVSRPRLAPISLPRCAWRRRSHRRVGSVPAVQALEERSLLSITIQVDYRYDTANFFNAPAKKQLMQQVADSLAANLNDNLSAITPSGGNTWTIDFFNPTTDADESINIPSIP